MSTSDPTVSSESELQSSDSQQQPASQEISMVQPPMQESTSGVQPNIVSNESISSDLIVQLDQVQSTIQADSF